MIIKEGQFYVINPLKLHINGVVLQQDEVIYISKDNNNVTVSIQRSDGESCVVSKYGLSFGVREF